jgi:hypothetical protein
MLKNHAMKMYWRAEVKLHRFLTSELDEGEWIALRFGRFASGEGHIWCPLDGGLCRHQSFSGHGGTGV